MKQNLEKKGFAKLEMLEPIVIEEESNIPSNYVKVPQIIETFVSALLVMADELNIKKDGAVDEITDRIYKHCNDILDFYINTKAQRVEDIVISKIIENLEVTGGFSHETAGSLSVFISEKYGIRIVTDGMHRLIKAFLCGVEELAWSLERVMPSEMSDEEMTKCEHEFLKAKNSRNAKMSISEQNRVAKESDNMSEKQQAYDETFTEAEIHVNAYGIEADAAIPTYTEGHDDWFTHLARESSVFYVGIDNFKKYSYNALIKFGKGNCSIDIPISWILVNLPTIRDPFLRWLSSKDFAKVETAWWWRYAMHGRSIESTIVRLLCRFNEHYRESIGRNIVQLEMISFLDNASIETKYFAIDCLEKEFLIEDAVERCKKVTIAKLNKTFNTSTP